MFCVLKEKTDYYPFTLRSLVSKILAKLARNRVIDQLKKCGLFPDFHFGFRYSQSTADLLPDVSNTLIDLGFLIGLGLLNLLHLICPRLPLGFLTNSSLMEFYVSYLALFYLSSILDGLEWLWMEIICKNT